MTAAHNPIPASVLVKALAALRMVTELSPSQTLTGAQWLRVLHAHNELEGHVDALQLGVESDVAMARGPQIAMSMGAQLPGVLS